MQAIAEEDDRFGYDRHATNRALSIANGVTVIILGFALGSFLQALPERNTADVQEVVKGLDRLIGLMTKEWWSCRISSGIRNRSLRKSLES